MAQIKKVWNVTLMRYPHTLFAIPDFALKNNKGTLWCLCCLLFVLPFHPAISLQRIATRSMAQLQSYVVPQWLWLPTLNTWKAALI